MGCINDNVVRKRTWSNLYEPEQSKFKANILRKKVMLSVGLGFKDIEGSFLAVAPVY